MGYSRFAGWQNDSEVYSENQIRAVLTELNLDVVGETEHDLQVLCPFHHNTGSPAFTINRNTGLWCCHNPACAERGNLESLVFKRQGGTYQDAKRTVNRLYTKVDYVKIIEDVPAPDLVAFDQGLIDRLRSQFPLSPGHKYMNGRGFNDETLRHFNVGYSDVRNSVVVPMYADDGMPLGFVGRSITGKSFQNSFGLPKSKSLWNIHNAKKNSGSIIVVESSFDAMMVHQAGYPNVVAALGGSLSQHQVKQLERYAETVIVMTDNDKPGRALGEKIQERVRRRVQWACIGEDLYPRGVKDATDMTEAEIRQVLLNTKSYVEYCEIMETW